MTTVAATNSTRTTRVTALAVMIVLIGLAAATVWGWQTGSRPYVVVSGSMAPAINVGDAVIVQPDQEVGAGEVATYVAQGQTVTHRVTDVTPAGYRTRGDANETADPTVVPREQVIGVATHRLPFGGYALIYLRQWAGIASILLLPVTLQLGWNLSGSLAGTTSPPMPMRPRRMPRTHRRVGRSATVPGRSLKPVMTGPTLPAKGARAVETARHRSGAVWS